MGRDEQTTQANTSAVVADAAVGSNEEEAARPETAASVPEEALTQPETAKPDVASVNATYSSTLDDQKVIQKSLATTSNKNKGDGKGNIASDEVLPVPVPETEASTGNTNAEEEETDLQVPPLTRLTRCSHQARYANLLPGAYRVTALPIPEANAPREPLGSGRLTSQLHDGSNSSSTRLGLEQAEQGPYEVTNNRNSNTSALPPEAGMTKALPVDEQILPVAYAQEEEKDEERHKWQKGFAFLSVAVILAVVLGITFGVQANQKTSNYVSSSTAKDTNNNNTIDTEPPQTNIDEREVLLEHLLPAYTLEPLRKDILLGRTSPQTQAYQWLINDPILFHFPDRRKVQRFALATFYYALGGEDWSLQNGWLDYYYTDYTDECSWKSKANLTGGEDPYDFGEVIVTSSAAGGSVCDIDGNMLELVLTDNGLAGVLPKEISLLTSLRRLDIANNEIRGTIPSEIGAMSSLQELVINNNKLTGSLPSEIGLLASLEIFICARMDITGTIPSEIGSMASMQEFQILATQIDGSIPREIYTMQNLTYLVIRQSALTGNIPSEVGLLSGLSNLQLDFNTLSGMLPTEIGLLTNLGELFLFSNLLSGSLPTEIGNLSSLQLCIFESNALTGNIPSEIATIPFLILLSLADSFFTGTVPLEIWTHPVRFFLDVSRNPQLEGSIPTEIGLGALATFFAYELPSWSGTVPSELGQLVNLENIWIHMANLSGSLPTELDNLPKLTWFKIEGNPLTGTLPVGGPNQTGLSLITMNNTLLTGTIPNFLCSISELVFDCPDICGCGCACPDEIMSNLTSGASISSNSTI